VEEADAEPVVDGTEPD